MTTHEISATAASKFLGNLQGYAYPGACLVAEMVQSGISKKEFSKIFGVNVQYLDSIWEGSISLDEVPIDVLRRIASALKIEPIALLIAAGYLRYCDFFAQGNKVAIQPFQSEWQEWLKSSYALRIEAFARDFGLPDDSESIEILETVFDFPGDTEKHGNVVHLPMPPGGNMTGNYLQDWLMLTCRSRRISPLVMGYEINMHFPELGIFLRGDAKTGQYSRGQLQRIARFLGMPLVTVLATLDLLDPGENQADL